MERSGILRTCDRCGKNHFRTYLSGAGFGTYEKPADGWIKDSGMDLCDECAQEWEKIKNVFLQEGGHK